MASSYSASLVVTDSKADIPLHLQTAVVHAFSRARQEKENGQFTIAISGGSLPKFLNGLEQTFRDLKVDPHFESWHVFLADERCVASTDPDSNMGAIQQEFLKHVDIPASQVYGIDESMLAGYNDDDDSASIEATTAAIAADYQTKMESVLRPTKSGSIGKLDLALLGMGPDGHTCSLFPGHPLVTTETTAGTCSTWVASINDSPKPPPRRITLTLSYLNQLTSRVIFCGAGASKAPILQQVLNNDITNQVLPKCPSRTVTMADPAPFPCGMVRPFSMTNDGAESLSSPEQQAERLIWVVDADAVKG